MEGLEEGELLELDFSDTSALSDPSQFEKKGRKDKGKKSSKKDAAVPTVPIPLSPPHVQIMKSPPQVAGKVKQVSVPAKSNGKEVSTSAGSSLMNGKNPITNSALNRGAALTAVAHAVPKNGVSMKKNDFIREVFTLMQVCLTWAASSFMSVG